MGFIKNLKDKLKKTETSDRYLDGYKKTSKSFGEKLSSVFSVFNGLSDDFLEQLMVTLLQSDVGLETSEKIVTMVQNEGKDRFINTYEDVLECFIEQMHNLYHPDDIKPITLNSNGPTVLLIVGVNGVGKTTSIAKLANYYQNEGKKVCTVAADTFRAGAVNQLKEWSARINVPCISGKENADPSSVIVDGCRYAKENNCDIVLIDTAGRLQNKVNLMKELEKMYRVIAKEIENAPQATLLVLDAITGQNGLQQAKDFIETTKVSGIILTKLDGTAKGGVILAIRDIYNLPVMFIGTGEGINDIQPFNIDEYLLSIAEAYQNEN